MGLQPLGHPIKTMRGTIAAFREILMTRQSRRDFPRWLASCVSRLRRRELGVERNPIPCFTFGAIDWLEETIQPNWSVFEWGSGASTLYFAKRVSRITAAEHHDGWARLVNSQLSAYDCEGNVLSRPPQNTIEPVREISARPEYGSMSFSKYVNAISESDTKYDLVVIDGRARVACGRRVVDWVKPGGYVILDNAERERYAEVFEILSKYPLIRFKGLGPYSVAPWETVVWRVEAELDKPEFFHN